MRVYIYYVLYDIQNSHPMRIPPSVSSILFSSSINSSGALERPPPPLSPRSPLVSLLSAIYFTKFSLSYGVTLVLEMFLRNIHGPTILLPATIFLFISPSRIETMLRDIRVTWLSSSLSYRCCLFRRVESFIYSFLSRLSFLFSFRSSLCCCGTKVGPFDNAISNLSRQNKFF